MRALRRPAPADRSVAAPDLLDLFGVQGRSHGYDLVVGDALTADDVRLMGVIEDGVSHGRRLPVTGKPSSTSFFRSPVLRCGAVFH